MDIYLQNYWALYLEFLYQFREIEYKGIPLSLLPNFYQYLDSDNHRVMGAASFKDMLVYKKVNENELHSNFEKYVSAVKINRNRESRGKGEVLYNFAIPMARKAPDNEKTRCMQEFERVFSETKENPVFSSEPFKTRILQNLGSIMDAIESWDEYLKNHHEQIRAVVLNTTEQLRRRVFVLVAKKYDISTFVLQHGAIMGEEAFFPLFTDYAVVYGDYERDWYEKKGVGHERVAITGYFKFDPIFQRSVMPREIICEQMGLCSSRPIIFLPTQPLIRATFLQLAESLASYDNVQVVIKPHPVEMRKKTIQEYVDLSIKLPNVRVMTQGDLYDLLPHVAVAITLESTVGLEAMLCGVPVVSYRHFFGRDFNYYDVLGEFRQDDVGKVVALAYRVLADPVYRAEAEKKRIAFLKYAYPLKLSRVNDFIDEVT